MKTSYALALAVTLLLPGALSGQEGTTPPERTAPTRERTPPTREQREAMRERIHERFLDMAAERLGLEATQRTRLGTLLEESNEARRAVAEEGMRLRREAADVLRADTPDRARAERILAELTRLRERELTLWRSEQDALADVLSAAQRLELMAMQARFNERVRNLRHDRGDRERGERRGWQRGERGGMERGER